MKPQAPPHTIWRGNVLWLQLGYRTPPLRLVATQVYGRDPGPLLRLSLKTADPEVAIFRMRKWVAAHTEIAFRARAMYDRDHKWGEAEFAREIDPALSPITKPDGTTVVATDDIIIEIAPDKTQTTRPNRMNVVMTNLTPIALKSDEYHNMIAAKAALRQSRAPKDNDQEIIDRYIEIKSKGANDKALLKRALEDWREVAKGKNFATATRDDARLFIKHQRDVRKLSPGRVTRIVAELKGAINCETKERKRTTPIKENIFAAHEIRLRPGEKVNFKDAYTDEHLAIMKANRELFADDEWLMLLWHCASGVRPEGLFSVEIDFWEERTDDAKTVRRTRGFYISKDKDKANGKQYGLRALPFPQSVLDAKKLDGSPLLPEKLTGRLFDPKERTLANLLRNINGKLAKIGINDVEAGLTLYSARHRADQRMAANVPEEHQKAIRGHTRTLDSERTISDATQMYGRGLYGHKFSMWQLKPSIDKIGF